MSPLDLNPYTFECQIDGLYRSEIERFQWNSDQTNNHGDMSEKQNSFPMPKMFKNGESIRINYAGFFAKRSDSKGARRHRIEIPFEKVPKINEVDDPLVPAQMYHDFAFRPIVVRSAGHEKCRTRKDPKCDRYQMKYAMSYTHISPVDMGQYACTFDYATAKHDFSPFEAKPVYAIKILSVDVIPDPGESENRRGVLIKWSVPIMDPCWTPFDSFSEPEILDPGMTEDELENFRSHENADRGGKSKEEYLNQLREQCRARSVNCGVSDPFCISLANLRVHFYMAIIPYLSGSSRSIEISGLNKETLLHYSRDEILNSLVANETDCEHTIACHVSRGFDTTRCEGLKDSSERQECNLLASTGMMKYTCGCTSFHDIVHEDIDSSIKTSDGGEIILEPTKEDTNHRKLTRGTQFMVKMHAEKLAPGSQYDTNSDHRPVEQILPSTKIASFMTPNLDLGQIRAPEIDRILPIGPFATFHLRDSSLAQSHAGLKIRASVCWHETTELNKALQEEIEEEGLLSPSSVHAYRCHEFNIVEREIRVAAFAPNTNYMAYVAITVCSPTMPCKHDKSLNKPFETEDFINFPNSPLGVESFTLEPSRTRENLITLKWEEPYAEANQYIRMSMWNGVDDKVYTFNPGEGTVTKTCDSSSRSRKNQKCHHNYKYTKTSIINIPLDQRSTRCEVELFDFRNIQSEASHAVYLGKSRNELEQTIFPPCTMVGGQWESSNKVRLEWNCPNVTLAYSTYKPRPTSRGRVKTGQNIAQLLTGYRLDDNLYFHIRWTATGIWDRNDTGWFLPYKEVIQDSPSKTEMYAYTVVQNSMHNEKKNFAKILNECQVLSFQVRLVLFPETTGRIPPCLIRTMEDDNTYKQRSKPRRLSSESVEENGKMVNCQKYAGSPFSDTLSLQITPRDSLPPPEYEISMLTSERLTVSFPQQSLKCAVKV